MLFNDPVFLFGYLPPVLAGYYLACRYGLHRVAIVWLLAASVLFYTYDDVRRLLPLIALSVGMNYLAGGWLRRAPSRLTLAAGVGANLLLLGYFKYAQFFADSLAALAGRPAPALGIVLPIGISFYTFTQIAFLVDVYRGHRATYRLADYALFVTFFPHLVAGPILRHNETVPQLERAGRDRVDGASVAVGWAWFSLGLGKKAVFADSLAPYAETVFGAVGRGEAIAFADAWIGTLSYSLQLYFDFSGYSDMAIGLALMTGIVFPLNFDSPYKAASIIDFWRRWHISLSSFLRDYLYIPLGGNRRGTARRYANLLITMVLGGLWHGASWNFVLWGALHGVALVINNVWRHATPSSAMPLGTGRVITLAFVVLAWVPFRADSLRAAAEVWRTLASVPAAGSQLFAGVLVPSALIAGLGAIALFAPNTQQILGSPAEGVQGAGAGWQPSLRWAIAAGVVFGVAASRSLSEPTAFLYFRF